MKPSPLETKTVRPGLLTYSRYSSDRHPVSRRAAPVRPAKPRPGKSHRGLKLAVLFLLALGAISGWRAITSTNEPTPSRSDLAAAVADGPKQCAGNRLGKLLVVSVSERHFWACQRQKVAYEAPVITGMDFLAADKTPRGTFKIYAKQTNITLTGEDSMGKWRDPVYYWMPFHDNQYGTYGFHDATWRSNSEFGNVSPNSKKASRGCVELPLGASQWLYNWAPVGTTVTIKN